MARFEKKKSKNWQQWFLALLPVIVNYVRPAFRELGPEAKAEAVQEAVANALVACGRLVEQGGENLAFATVLARFAVTQVRSGRQVGGRLSVAPPVDENSASHKAVKAYVDKKKVERKAEVAAAKEFRKNPKPAATTIADFGAGKTCTIADSGATLAATIDDYNRFTKLSVVQDEIGAARMESEGRIARLPQGTSIKIISSGFLRAEVRVLDGPRKGESGFISAEFSATAG